MFEPGVEKSRHFQWLFLPGLVGLALFTMVAPGFPWWSGLAIYPVLVLACLHLYSLCFPPAAKKNDLRGLVLATLLVLFQIAFWVVIFAIARYQYLKSLGQ